MNINNDFFNKRQMEFASSEVVNRFKYLFRKKDILEFDIIKRLRKIENSDTKNEDNYRCLVWFANYIKSEDIIRELYRIDEVSLHCSLSRNPNTPKDILHLLCENRGFYEYVGSNKNASAKTLRYIYSMVMSAYFDIHNHLIYEKYKAKVSLSMNPNIPIDILKRLSQDDCGIIRGHVARNKSTPINILEELSKDDNEDVRGRVAENKNTPIGVFINLKNDHSDWVKKMCELWGKYRNDLDAICKD